MVPTGFEYIIEFVIEYWSNTMSKKNEDFFKSAILPRRGKDRKDFAWISPDYGDMNGSSSWARKCSTGDDP